MTVNKDGQVNGIFVLALLERLPSSKKVNMGFSFSLCSNDFPHPMGLSAPLHSADIPKWCPYPKLFNEPLRVSLPFLLLVRFRKRAFDTSSKQKSLSLS